MYTDYYAFRRGINQVDVVGSSQSVLWLSNFWYMYFIFNSDLKHGKYYHHQVCM